MHIAFICTMVCVTMIVQPYVLSMIPSWYNCCIHNKILTIKISIATQHTTKYPMHTDKMHYYKVGLPSKFIKVIEYIARLCESQWRRLVYILLTSYDPCKLLPRWRRLIYKTQFSRAK